jgi:uncharacterized membrane protein (UPF0127 family)
VAASFLRPLVVEPGRPWILRNLRSRRVVAAHVESAFDSPSRRKGLLGRTSLPDAAALILAPCSSIHTFFMKFAIDVIFVARDGRVLSTRRALPPWRIAIAWRAMAVVELGAGAIERSDTRAGDVLELNAE